jgi:hypothetical protein
MRLAVEVKYYEEHGERGKLMQNLFLHYGESGARPVWLGRGGETTLNFRK